MKHREGKLVNYCFRQMIAIIIICPLLLILLSCLLDEVINPVFEQDVKFEYASHVYRIKLRLKTEMRVTIIVVT